MTAPISRWRYLPWLARDVGWGPFALFVTSAITIGVVHAFVVANAKEPSNAAVLQGRVLYVCITVASLFASGGQAGLDNQRGWYRIWFSKPMSPVWYYLQRFLLGGLAVLCAPLVFGVTIALLEGIGTGLSFALLAQAALSYLLIGGCVLFFSNFSAKDWLFVFILSFVQNRIHDFMLMQQMTRESTEPSQVIIWLERILPPFHLVAPSAALLGGGATLSSGTDRYRLVGYGLGLVLVALFIMDRKPMGSGGRS